MDILKSFVLDGSEFAVNVMWDDGTPFFRATEIGAVLGLKEVTNTVAQFDADEKEEKVAQSNGGLQNTVFLTEAGLYRLLMISRKPVARPFQKWVTSVLVSIRESGNYELQKCVQDLENEKALHAATSRRLGARTDAMAALARELKDIATTSMLKSHKSFANKESEIKLQKIKLEQLKELNEIKKLLQATAGAPPPSAPPPPTDVIEARVAGLGGAAVEARVAGLGGAAVDPILLFADNRRYTQALGAKVQRYSPDGKTLLQTYESAIAALRDASLDAPSRTRIHQAVADRTVYKDFRWMFLDRSFPDDTVQELGETAQKERDIRKGFVAMLNLDKTQIMEVFQNQKEAGIDRKFRSSAPVCTSLKNGTQSGGHYFKMWYDCPDDLKAEFLSRKSLPDKAVPGGQRVVQLHPITRDVVRVYASVSDVIKDHRFSRSSLKNVIENGFIAKGYRWSSSKPA